MRDTLTPRQYPELTERRRMMQLVRPFADRFQDWNHRAAKASAAILSHVTTTEEKSEHRKQLAALTVEVEAAYAEFEILIAGQPHTGRIADVANAFERLITILRKV